MKPREDLRGRLRAALTAIFVAALVVTALVAGAGSGAVLAEPDPAPPEAAEPDEGPLVPQGEEPELILIYTGRVRGFVEPCGCPRNPAGGLARRAGYLDLLKKEYPKATVALIETGEFASEFDEPGRVKTAAYVQGLNDFEYDVVGLGERELAGGLDAFNELFEDRRFPLVSATWTGRGGQEPMVDPYVVREYELRRGRKFKIGFIGLTSYNSRFASIGRDGSAVVGRDPVAQARKYLPAVAAESDFVVLLANMNSRDIRRVVEAVPGSVDLALAAFSDRLSPRAMEEIGGVPTLYSGDQGRRLGEVRLFLEKGAVRKMKAHHIHLTEKYPEVPRYQRMIDGMLARVNEMMKARAEAEPVAETAAGGEAMGDREHFVGSGRCLECHDAAYRVWEHSRHAHAMETLVNANQDYNPECIACHNTGYGQVMGFRSARATPNLVNVQCEACHGLGSIHLADTSVSYGTVPPRTCFSCHTRENSPEFSFFKYWNTIRH